MAEIEGIGGRLTLDASNWSAGAKEARAEFDQTVDAIKAKSAEVSTATNGMASAYEQYRRESEADLKATMVAMDQNRKSTNDWAEAFRSTGTPVKELQAELRDLQAQLVGLKSAQADAGAAGSAAFNTQIKATQLEIQQVTQQLRVARAEQGEFNEGFRGGREALTLFNGQLSQLIGGIPGLSQGLTGAGGAAMGLSGGAASAAVGVVGLTVAVGAGTAKLTELGAEWKQTVDNIANGANITTDAAHRILVSFESIGPKVAQDALSLGNAYATVAGQLGTYQGQALSSAQATQFMAAAGDGALASGEKLETVVKALAEGMTSSHSRIEDVNTVMNALYITSRNANIGIGDTALLAGRLQERMGAAAPGIIGVGEALTLAAQAGATGQRGMQPVMTLMEHLSDITPKAQADLAALGVQVEKNANGQIDFAGTFVNLKVAYDNLSTAEEKHALLTDLVGQQTGVLSSMLKSSDDQIQAVVRSYEDNNRVSQDAQHRGEELGVMFGKLASQVKNAAGAMAEDMASALVEDGRLLDTLGTKIQANIKWWQEWAREQQAAGHSGKSWRPADIPASDADWEASHRMIPPGGTTSQNGGGGTDRTPIDVQAIREGQDALTAMGTEGQRVSKIMADYYKLPADLGPEGEKAVKDLTAATNAQAAALERADGPEAQAQAAKLRQLTDEWAAAVASRNNDQIRATQSALEGYESELNGAALAAEADKRAATEQARRDAEAKRIADEEERTRKHQQQLADEWANAVEAASEKVANAEEAAAIKGADALDKYNDAVARAEDSLTLKQANAEAQSQLDEAVTARKAELDQDLQNLKDHNAETLEATRAGNDQQLQALRDAASERQDQVRKERAERDESLRNDRTARDSQTRDDRAEREGKLRDQRAQQDAQSEHQRKLAEIQKKGGPGMAEALAVENASFQVDERRLALAAYRAEADRVQKDKDAAADRALKAKDAADDRAQKDKDAADDRTAKEKAAADELALRTRLAGELAAATRGLREQEQALATTNAQDLKDTKLDLEKQFHLDKESIWEKEEADQIASAQRVLDATLLATQESIDKARQSADQSLQKTGTRIEQQGGANPAGSIAPFSTPTPASYLAPFIGAGAAPTPFASAPSPSRNIEPGGEGGGPQVNTYVYLGMAFGNEREMADYIAHQNALSLTEAQTMGD